MNRVLGSKLKMDSGGGNIKLTTLYGDGEHRQLQTHVSGGDLCVLSTNSCRASVGLFVVFPGLHVERWPGLAWHLHVMKLCVLGRRPEVSISSGGGSMELSHAQAKLLLDVSNRTKAATGLHALSL